MQQRYSEAQVIAALHATDGMVFLAAKRLGCSPRTIENYINRSPAIKEAARTARGMMVDIAESKLFDAITRGDPWAIALFLRTQAKDRGYTEHHEVRSVHQMSDAALRATIAHRLGLPDPEKDEQKRRTVWK